MKRLSIYVLLVAFGWSAVMAETYRSVPLSKLKFEAPQDEMAPVLAQQIDAFQLMLLDARLPTECYLTFDDPEVGELSQSLLRLVFKGDAKLPLSGALELALDYSADEVKTFRFTIEEGSAGEIDEKDFTAARQKAAKARCERNLPGVAWFRHQAGHDDSVDDVTPEALMTTYGIFGGGRAISDNLALDRDLILGAKRDNDDDQIRIDTIKGVTVKAIDWSKSLPKGEVTIDPLALAIPDDQHALFAPSLHGLLGLMNRFDAEFTPVAGMASSQSSYRGLLDRYRRQLGLDLTDAAARLLPVRSVAVTGGDPYFATGTDVAILMESENPAMLFKALELAIQAKAGAAAKLQRDKNLERLSFMIPDKGISSHLCRIGELVFVTNSMAQVHRLVEVADKRAPALGRTDEFRVFRHRHPKADEHAFVFLSDATIRRWAGPVTRIGASRRNRALAALNELTCRGITSCGQEEDFSALLGRVVMMDGRAISEHYGSAEFLTPISELQLGEVTSLEKEAYERWREGYETGWRQAFDPIAIQLKLSENSVDIDLTVLPLNVNSDLQEVMAVAGKAGLSPRARMRPEGSVMHLACALDHKSKWFERFDEQLVSMLPDLKIKPLSWLGESVSVDLLDSLFWEGLGNHAFFDGIEYLPVVARVEVKSKIKLGLFLTAMRTMVQSSAPDTMVWINRKYGERSYVVVAQQDDGEFNGQLQVCYAIVGDVLLVTLSERNLKRAMDLEQMELTEQQLKQLPEAKSLVLDADPAVLAMIDNLGDGGAISSRLAQISWDAIPILNEWRRRFPDRDPAVMHESLFGVTIACPGGKGYRWNEEHLTMESVTYGHRGAPREAHGDAKGVFKYGRMHSGIDFFEDGLRLRLHLGPKVELPSLPEPEIGGVIGKAADLYGYKIGRVLSYAGQDAFGKHNWKFEVLGMEKTPKGLVVRTHEPWADEEDRGDWFGVYLAAEDGIWRMGGKDETTTSSYTKPLLDLPNELRPNEVHRTRAVGQDVYEDNGEKDIDRKIERQELRVLGTETISVKAGKFENCVLIERRTESLWGDYYDLTESREWYHPGTGLIKIIDQNGYGGELIKIEEKPN